MPAGAWEGAADRHRRALVAADVPVPGRDGVVLPGPVLVEVAWSRSGSVRPVEPWPEHASSRLVVSDLPDADLARGLAEYGIASVGAATIGALVDADPALRLALPFTLGVRDLAPLVDPLVLDRSSLDLGEATALARTFVPTAAYGRALETLDRFGFAVLTGPPEMGKTAIARMVGLARLTDGWEVHECTTPDAVWRVHDPARRQLFIADDAFGSTEYRPDAAARWAADMERLLRMLDEGHWLVWTSRPAPLRAGLARLHRERGAERFPQPGEVLVDASALSVHEKALILFRHARASRAPGDFRHGGPLVGHPHFTPERIRRMVALGRPSTDALAEPTPSMRESFDALDEEQRTLLVAMLDVPPGPVAERDLTHAVRRHAAQGGVDHDPHALVEGLADHFLHVADGRVGWVHPSWRDLVVDAVAGDGARRLAFLSVCGPDGVLLALSTGGGAGGERWLPLLDSDADFDALGDQLARLAREAGDTELARLMDGIDHALDVTRGTVIAYEAGGRSGRLSADTEVQALAETLLSSLSRRWAREHRPVRVDLLERWFSIADAVSEPPEPPGAAIGFTWFALVPEEPVSVDDAAGLARLDDWLALAEILYVRDPHHLLQLAEKRDFAWLGALAEAVAATVADAPEARRDQLRRIVKRISRLKISPSQTGAALVELWLPEEPFGPSPVAEPAPEAEPDLVARVLGDLPRSRPAG